MILFSGLDSVLESIYTDNQLTERMSNVDILVNPESITYLTGKICILTKKHKNLDLLGRNGNTIITRVRCNEGPGIIYDPYIPKVFSRIVWNGDYVRALTKGTYDKIEFSYNTYTGILSYPKPREYFQEREETGELNSFGYLLYQLGENLFQDSVFQDIDLIKIGKLW